MKRRNFLAIAIGTAVAVVGGWIFLSNWTYEVVISQSQLQEMVEKYFPVEQSYMFVFNVTFKNPQVILEPGADRVKFGLDIESSAPFSDNDLSGRGVLSAGIRFNSETGEFFLKNPKIENLEVQDLPSDTFSKFDQMANEKLQEFLADRPVYTVNPDDLRRGFFRFVLKDVVIRDQSLVVKLGIGL